MFTITGGDRPGDKNVAISMSTVTFITNFALVFTDGQTTQDLQLLQSAAGRLQLVARVIAVGIGSDVNLRELNLIASNPDNEHVILPSKLNSTDIEGTVNRILNLICV